MKPLIVGLCPGRRQYESGQHGAFSGPTGKFLANLIGVSDLDAFVKYFDICNLWPRVDLPEPSFLNGQAKLMSICDSTRTMVLCGRVVQRAFECRLSKQRQLEGRTQIAWCDPCLSPFLSVPCYVIPHPSGRCREWNNHDNRVLVAAFLRSLL